MADTKAKRHVDELRTEATRMGRWTSLKRASERVENAADFIERAAAALAEIEALHKRSRDGSCSTCCGNEYYCETHHDHGRGKPSCATAAAIQRAREAKP